MSAGNFVNTRYEMDASNGGYITKARVQPETVAATDGTTPNAAPAEAVDLPVSAYSSKGKREYGIRMRAVLLDQPATPPTGYSGNPLRIPVLQEATYAGWAIGASINYLGTSWNLLDKIPEDVQ